MSKAKYAKIGESVKVVVNKRFERCGYPLTIAMVEEECYKEIVDLTNKALTAIGEDPYNCDSKIASKVNKACAYKLIKDKKWGGSKREIYEYTDSLLKDVVGEVIEKKYVKTGQRVSGYKGGFDYEGSAPYLSDEKTHCVYKLKIKSKHGSSYYERRVLAEHCQREDEWDKAQQKEPVTDGSVPGVLKVSAADLKKVFDKLDKKFVGETVVMDSVPQSASLEAMPTKPLSLLDKFKQNMDEQWPTGYGDLEFNHYCLKCKLPHHEIIKCSSANTQVWSGGSICPDCGGFHDLCGDCLSGWTVKNPHYEKALKETLEQEHPPERMKKLIEMAKNFATKYKTTIIIKNQYKKEPEVDFIKADVQPLKAEEFKQQWQYLYGAKVSPVLNSFMGGVHVATDYAMPEGEMIIKNNHQDYVIKNLKVDKDELE